jgi:hypothetical protein
MRQKVCCRSSKSIWVACRRNSRLALRRRSFGRCCRPGNRRSGISAQSQRLVVRIGEGFGGRPLGDVQFAGRQRAAVAVALEEDAGRVAHWSPGECHIRPTAVGPRPGYPGEWRGWWCRAPESVPRRPCHGCRCRCCQSSRLRPARCAAAIGIKGPGFQVGVGVRGVVPESHGRFGQT